MLRFSILFLDRWIERNYVGSLNPRTEKNIIFDFEENTATSVPSAVLPRIRTTFTRAEEDYFGDCIVYSKRKSFQMYSYTYPSLGTFAWKEFDKCKCFKDAFLTHCLGRASQPGIDFFCRVDLNGSLWFADWGS
jgi:hypothetical protein